VFLVCSVSKTSCGLLFFEGTITAENYQNLFTQLIALLEENEQDCWYQQDGVTFHTAKTTTAFLQDFFGDHIVRRGLWPT
jgi:hypothetical protein